MQKELKPCPRCGSENLHYESYDSYWHSGGRQVVCYDCGNRSPVRPSDESATEWWNRRAEVKSDD